MLTRKIKKCSFRSQINYETNVGRNVTSIFMVQNFHKLTRFFEKRKKICWSQDKRIKNSKPQKA
jgi:hypothetical protein